MIGSYDPALRSLLSMFIGVILWTVSGLGLANQNPAKSPVSSARKTKSPPRNARSVGKLKQEQAYREYVVRIYEDAQSHTFEIWRKGQRLHRQKGHRFYIGNIRADEDELKDQLSPIPMGLDLTGEGEPDLVISEWTGGAHCCYLAYVFQIGRAFRRLATIDARDGSFNFIDLDGDGRREVVLRDWTFAYWKTSFAESPAPKVILRFEKGAYRVAGDLMRQPGPSYPKLVQRAQEISINEKWSSGRVPSDLWGYMLDLIYTGHSKLAGEFLDRAWPRAQPGKDRFLSEFQAQLAKSPYWSEIRAWNTQ